MATSYSNSGGTGNRLGSITVTAAGSFFGDMSGLVDGGTGTAGWFNGGAANTYTIQFDFGFLDRIGTKVIIDEAKWYQSASNSHGTFQWEGSDDASAWTAIGATFTLGGATTQTQTTLSGNTTAYRYYRLKGISGTTSSAPNLQEIQFKIEAVYISLSPTPGPPFSFWRLTIANQDGSVTCTVPELKFYNASAVQIPTTGGAAAASDTTSFAAAHAFDGNTATLWAAGSVAPSAAAPHWLQYQFSSAVAVASFSITTRNDSFYMQAPGAFVLSASNDGATWVVQGGFSATWSSAGQVKTFALTPASAFGDFYRIFCQTNGGGSVFSASEIVFMDAGSVALSLTAGAAMASTVFTDAVSQGPHAAFNGSTSDYWASLTASSGQWIGFRFAGSPAVGSFSIRARSAGFNQTPVTFKLQISTDGGSTWTDVQSYTAATWTAGAVQTFVAPVIVTAAQPLMMVVIT